MLENVRGSNGKILMAALAGITAGIITGLLMAPETGLQTRQSIARKAGDITDILNQSIRKVTGKSKKKKGGKGKKKRTESADLP
jgi:gas vesicle protein